MHKKLAEQKEQWRVFRRLAIFSLPVLRVWS